MRAALVDDFKKTESDRLKIRLYSQHFIAQKERGDRTAVRGRTRRRNAEFGGQSILPAPRPVREFGKIPRRGVKQTDVLRPSGQVKADPVAEKLGRFPRRIRQTYSVRQLFQSHKNIVNAQMLVSIGALREIFRRSPFEERSGSSVKRKRRSVPAVDAVIDRVEIARAVEHVFEHLNADVERILCAGIPVMGHLGLTPQSINKFGTYTVRAREEAEAQKLIDDAHLLEEIGCFAIVLEKIPAELAARVASELSIPIIGIGAGGGVDGQVLVMHDMLGINMGFSPRFLRRYANIGEEITRAVQAYIEDVKTQDFPNEKEQY